MQQSAVAIAQSNSGPSTTRGGRPHSDRCPGRLASQIAARRCQRLELTGTSALCKPASTRQRPRSGFSRYAQSHALHAPTTTPHIIMPARRRGTLRSHLYALSGHASALSDNPITLICYTDTLTNNVEILTVHVGTLNDYVGTLMRYVDAPTNDICALNNNILLLMHDVETLKDDVFQQIESLTNQIFRLLDKIHHH